MKKIIPSFSNFFYLTTLKTIALTIFIALLSFQSNAQTALIGTGTDVPPATLYSPLYRFSASSTATTCRSDILFLASEMAAAGIPTGATITAVEFYKTNTANFLIPAQFNMYVGNTSNTTLPTTTTWASVMSTHTQVYGNTSFNLPNTAGWVMWTFTSPYVYTGGSFEIATDLVMTGGVTGANGSFQWQYTAAIPADRIAASATVVNATVLNGNIAAYKHRPNIRITYFTTPCTGSPTPGIVIPTLKTFCPGGSTSLTLSGFTGGTGITLQWQSSPDSINWTDISGENTAYYATPALTSTTYYRNKVTCTGNPSAYTAGERITVIPLMAAGTYTINPNLPASSTNFTSFASLNAALTCGISGPIVINVNPGTYIGSLSLANLSGTSVTNTITINGRGSTLMDTLIAGKPDYVLQIKGTSYVTVDSLNLTAHANSTKGIVLSMSDAHYNTIKHCTITGNLSATTTTLSCLSLSGSTTSPTAATTGKYNNFENNEFVGGYYSVTVIGTSATRNVLGNRFVNNIFRDFYSYGIYNIAADSTQIVGNDIHRLNRGTVATGYGVYLGTNSKKVLISKNRIHDLAASSSTVQTAGVYLTSNDAPANEEVWIVNNIIYNNFTGGATYGIYNSGSDGAFSYYNTISIDNPTATAGLAYGVYQTTSATRVHFMNNIIYVSKGGSGAKYAIHLATTASTVTADYNDLFVDTLATGTGVKNIGYWGAAFVSFANWQAANTSAFDQHSLNKNPIFTNPSVADFKPNSPIINNLGIVIAGVSDDIFGILRGATPDMGAIEFSIAANDAGVYAFSAPFIICPGISNIKVKVKNFASDTLRTFNVNWSVNNVLQTPVSWSGKLASGLDTNIVIGNYNFAANVVYAIKAWTNNPNSTSDGNPQNDTLLKSNIKTAFLGTYTVGGVGDNYATFSELVTDLSTYGVCGPVVVNVNSAASPYTGGIILTNIAGLSAASTLHFKGNGSVINTTSNGFTLTNMNYVTIDSFVINVNGSAGFGINLVLGDFNTFKNNTINISNDKTTTSYAGIALSGSTTSAITGGRFRNNTIENNILNGGYYMLTIYGMSNDVTSAFGNVVRNNKLNDAYMYASYFAYTDSLTVDNNEMSRPTRTAATISTFYGAYFATGNTQFKFSNNKIHSPFPLGYTGLSGVYGMYTMSDAVVGKENVVYNNTIYNIQGPSPVFGFYNTGADNTQYYHNTINIEGAGGASAIYGMYQLTPATNLVYQNNTIYINRVGTGTYICLAFTNTSSTIISNYNNLYGNAGVKIGKWGSVNYETLSDWKTLSPVAFDQNSISADPLANGRWNMIPQLGTPLAGAGVHVPLVSKDILGNSRNGFFPYIGAYEIAGDFTGPKIKFSPITNSINTSTYVLNSFVTVTDTAGIDTSLAGRPRLYYKKTTDTNAYYGNTSATVGWKYVIASNNSSPFNFTIDYSKLNAGSVVSGDILEYFVSAKDVSGKVSIANGSTYKEVTNVTLLPSDFPVINSNSYKISYLVSGTIHVGTGYPFTSLTKTGGVFEYLNENVLAGNVDVLVHTNLSEDGLNQLNVLAETGAGNYKVSIKSNADTLRTISGSYSGGLIRFNGTDRVTLDGAGTTNGHYLKFQNNSTANNTATIQLKSFGPSQGCTDVNIRNAIISTGSKGNATLHTFGIFAGGQTISDLSIGDDFDNLVIENDSIYKAHQAIFISSSDSGVNNNIKILNNALGSSIASNYLGYAGLNISNSTGALIKGNTIKNAEASGTTVTDYNNPKGIYLSKGVVNSRISKNVITGIKYTSLAGYGARGIHIYTRNAASNDTIDNNMISDILGNGSDLSNGSRDIVAGIMIQGGSTGLIKLYYNSIDLRGNANNADSIDHVSAALFVDTSVSGLEIKNNSFSNGIVNTARNLARAYAIYSRVGSAAYLIFDNNNYYVSGSQGVLGHQGFTLNTLAEIKMVTGNNTNSVSGNPLFLSGNNLHARGGVLYHKGSAIAGFTDDIDGDVRNATTPSIGADEYVPLANDLSALTVISPVNYSCGLTSDSIRVAIANYGTSVQTGFQVNAIVSGVNAATLSKTYTKSLIPGAMDTVTLGYFNNATPGFINIKTYTDLNTDNLRDNDTINVKREINVIPSSPTVANVSTCKGDTAILTAVSNAAIVNWYSSLTSTTPIGTGLTLTLPNVTAPTTVYAEATAIGGVTNTLTTTLSGSNNNAGVMFDVEPQASAIEISGFDYKSASSGPRTLEIYYRTGTYLGNDNSVTGWTLLTSITDTFVYGLNTINLGANALTLQAGQTYGFYFTYTTGSIFYSTTPNPTVYQNADLKIINGRGKTYPFGSGTTYDGRSWNGTILYRKAGACLSPRTLATVSLTVSPHGALVAQSTPFNGLYHTGTEVDPDGACMGDTLTYLLTPPTGYNAVDYGTTWTLLSPIVKTAHGATPNGTVTMNGLSLQYIASSSEVDSTLIFTASVKSLTTGCDSNIIRFIKVHQTPVVNLGGDKNVCETDSVVLDAGNAGATYAWSTGATTQTISVKTAGTYTVTVTNPGGCVESSSATITMLPKPVIELGENKAICAGTSVTLNPGLVIGATYIWSTGDTTSTIDVNTAGTYMVTVTSNKGCSAKDTITVTQLANPSVNLGLDHSICVGDSITLDAGNTGSAYLWNTGDTTQQINVKLAGTYSVTVTNQNGCTGVDDVIVNHYPEPNAGYTFIVDKGSVTFSVTPAVGVSYTWNFGDGGTSVLTSPIHVYQSTGVYTVSLTAHDLNTGCKKTEIQTITIVTVGVGEVSSEVFNMNAHPNPFNISTKIAYYLPYDSKTSLEIFDLLGRKVSTLVSNETQAIGNYEYNFEGEGIGAGIYLVKLTVNGEVAIIRIAEVK